MRTTSDSKELFRKKSAASATANRPLLHRLWSVDHELWLVLGIFVVSFLVNRAISAQRMALTIYTLPTIFSAYLFGRRHAVMTATFTALVASFLLYSNPSTIFVERITRTDKWTELAAWGGMLVITAYAMGSLYERQNRSIEELHRTYNGLLAMVQKSIVEDPESRNHSLRVSAYSEKIAERLGFDAERIEDVRVAALLHDIGGSDVNRDVLTKALELTGNRNGGTRKRAAAGDEIGDSYWNLRRILPIVLEHHDRFHRAERRSPSRHEIPIEARILIVADVFDSLTTDRPYRRSLSTEEALKCIEKQSASGFDPEVVRALRLSLTPTEKTQPAEIAAALKN